MTVIYKQTINRMSVRDLVHPVFGKHIPDRLPLNHEGHPYNYLREAYQESKKAGQYREGVTVETTIPGVGHITTEFGRHFVFRFDPSYGPGKRYFPTGTWEGWF
jgi:hypothetical protein